MHARHRFIHDIMKIIAVLSRSQLKSVESCLKRLFSFVIYNNLETKTSSIFLKPSKPSKDWIVVSILLRVFV